MKTAMQELIDFIESQEYNFLNKEQLESCNNIQAKAKELIEKEKQQIIDAVEWELKYRASGFKGEMYYNSTYEKVQ